MKPGELRPNSLENLALEEIEAEKVLLRLLFSRLAPSFAEAPSSVHQLLINTLGIGFYLQGGWVMMREDGFCQ